MGFRTPIDYNSVHHQIYLTGVEINSPYNDGFTSWHLKQDLYKIKWLVDEIIRTSPTFAGEDEFVNENSKKIMWKRLNEK